MGDFEIYTSIIMLVTAGLLIYLNVLDTRREKEEKKKQEEENENSTLN